MGEYQDTSWTLPSVDDFSPDTMTGWDSSYGSFNAADYNDPLAGAGGQYGPAFTGGTTTDVLTAGGQMGPGGVPQGGGSWWDQLTGGNAGGVPMPGGGGLGAPGGLGLLQGGLGLAGGLAGLIGTLTGGGVTGTQTPRLPTNAMAQLNQGVGALGPAAMGQLPAQQMQMALLQSLMQGQIPPQMAALVARAYDPAYQDAATRATNAGRQAGFYDAPLSSPPGGAIMGPAAAQLQGQQANSLLGLMQSFPQLFNQPISNQIGAAGQQGGQLLQGAQLQRGVQQSAPLGPQIGTQIGSGLQGISQTLGQNQQNQALNQILQRQMQGQGGINTFSNTQSYP